MRKRLAGIRTFMGDDAGKQPGSLQEVLLHERAVAWIRCRLACTVPVRCWEETRQEYSTRLKRCCEHINDEHDVDALCRAFPKRCKKLDDTQGGRLSY